MLRMVVATRCLGSRQVATLATCSLLEHSEYRHMRAVLEEQDELASPLEAACRFILGLDLRVSTKVLNLNSLALASLESPRDYTAGLRELRAAGEVVKGRYTVRMDRALVRQYEGLVAGARVDRHQLTTLLGAASIQRTFMLQRQLVGFYLLQGLEDGHKRLPVEVVIRLSKVLHSGTFTEEEDAAILSWVEEHGPTRWRELARSLGRTYPNAAMAVANRFATLQARMVEKKVGKFMEEEVEVIIEKVLAQNPRVLESSLAKDILWEEVAGEVERTRDGVYKFYSTQVHPTLRRYLAGTLGEDVRGALVEAVVAASSQDLQVDFREVAGRRGFEGHTGYSLRDLYHSMRDNTRATLGLTTRREVTVDQVDQWWRTSKRKAKSGSRREREEGIVAAYQRVVARRKEGGL